MCLMKVMCLDLILLGLVLSPGLTWAQNSVPEKPGDLRVSSRFEGATTVAVLSWKDQSDNEIGFEILRSDNGKEFHLVDMVGANNTRSEDKIGKYIAGAFSYKVRAFTESGRSLDSNIATVWF